MNARIYPQIKLISYNKCLKQSSVKWAQTMPSMQRIKRPRCRCVIALFVLVACVTLMWIFWNGDITLNVDITTYPLQEPILEEDFPFSPDTEPRIPRVIHQTWKSEFIPTQFVENVRTFVKHNPSFEYYFWTDDSARQLIKERHPDLLQTFDDYVEPVRKADMLRYVVLYEFGGIYVDLDTACLRPLDRVTSKYSCVLSPEPYEHSTLIYNTKFLVTNSIMICRAKHPFLLRLMYNLPDFSHFSQDIDSSGPNFVTLQLNLYRREINENRRKLTDLHEDSVYLPSSQYFQNELDPVRFDQFEQMCASFEKLNSIGKSGCVSLARRGMRRRSRSKYAFTAHQFYHTGYKWMPQNGVSISEIIPEAIILEN